MKTKEEVQAWLRKSLYENSLTYQGRTTGDQTMLEDIMLMLLESYREGHEEGRLANDDWAVRMTR